MVPKMVDIGKRTGALALVLLAGLWTLAAQAQDLDQEWRAVEYPGLDQKFVRAHGVGHFRKVLIDPLSVWYAEDEPSAAAAANVTALQNRFAAIFRDAFESAGFQIVDVAGEDVLRVHVEIVDLKINRPAPGKNPFAGRYAFDTAWGKLTLVAQFRDGATDEVLVHVADHERDLDAPAASTAELWDQTRLTLADWATGLSGALHDLPAVGAYQLAQLPD